MGCSMCKLKKYFLIKNFTPINAVKYNLPAFGNNYYRGRTSIEACSGVAIMSEGLETSIQITYIGLLLSILVTFVGSFTIQLLARRELGEAAKIVADRINSKSVSASDYYE